MLLSIVIPSYQHREYIISCIDAAFTIPIVDKEIIVIDDGSSDDSVSVIKDWISERDGRNIRLISHENRGLTSVLNEGLTAAKGKYIYFVASDDQPIGDGILALILSLEENSTLQFAIGNAEAFIWEMGIRRKWTVYGDSQKAFFSLGQRERASAIFLDYPEPLLIQSSVFRKQLLLNVGMWDSDLTLDDYPMFAKILLAYPVLGRDFIYFPDISCVNYRQHAENSHRNLHRQASILVQVIEKICPLEIKPIAVARTYVRYAFSALRRVKIIVATRFLGFSVKRVGFLNTLIEIIKFVTARFAKIINGFIQRKFL